MRDEVVIPPLRKTHTFVLPTVDQSGRDMDLAGVIRRRPFRKNKAAACAIAFRQLRETYEVI